MGGGYISKKTKIKIPLNFYLIHLKFKDDLLKS